MSSKRKRLSAAERKPQILRSAIRAMAESNYRTTSIAEIATEAGITEPAVYRYFPTKKALFIAIIEDVGNRVLTIWQSIIDKSDDPVSALRSISLDYYERAMTRRGDLKVLFQSLAEVDDTDIRDALRAQFRGYVDLLRGLLERCATDGIIHPEVDSRTAAWSFLSVGFTLNLVGLLGFDEEMDKERLLLIQDLYLGSLANGAAAKQNLVKRQRASE